MTLINSIFSALILFAACKDKPDNQNAFSNKKSANEVIDTSKFTIIPLKESHYFAFDSSYTETSLNESEFFGIKALLNKSIKDYNSLLKVDVKYFGVDTSKYQYKMQIVPALNKKGGKEVWINAFCTADGKNWKTTVVFVKDGSNCFFNLKINLATKRYYNFYVNGYA
jgi:hypothetical protein